MIIAIVLTYNPDLRVLSNGVAAIAAQVDRVLVVDNGSDIDVTTLSDSISVAYKERVEFSLLGRNIGVGAAHNHGISWARSRGASYIVILDHDSIPAPDMVERLLETLCDLESKGLRVAAVGPRYFDSYTGSLSGFVRLGRTKPKRVTCKDEGLAYVRTDFLISSGSLIPISVLDDIGGMDESLFIDHIDTEWGLRALSRGYILFGVCAATMEHSLGDRTRRFWFLRWRNVPIHSPIRYYYIFRNSIILMRRPYIPWRWILNDLSRLIYISIFHLSMVRGGYRRLVCMLEGVRDGLKGITGKYGQTIDDVSD